MSDTITQINVGGGAAIGGDLRIGAGVTNGIVSTIMITGDGNVITPGTSPKGTLRSGKEAFSIQELIERLQRAHEESTRRLQQLQALRSVDQAITSSLDLQLTIKYPARAGYSTSASGCRWSASVQLRYANP